MSQYDLSGYSADAQKQVENFLSQGILEGITYKENKQYLQNGDYMSRADQTRYEIDRETLKIRKIEAKIAQDRLDYYLKYGTFPDEEGPKEPNKGAKYRDATTRISNFGDSQTPYLIQYNGESNIPGYKSEKFEPGKKKDFNGEDTAFNESVPGDGFWPEYFNQEWMANPKTIVQNLQNGRIIQKNPYDLSADAKKKVLQIVLPEVETEEVLDAKMWRNIAQNVIIFEDNSGTEAVGSKTPQYLVVPRRWMEENLTTPKEQTPAATPKEKEKTSAAQPTLS